MLKLLKLFAWIVFVGVLLVAFDQLLIRVPLATPGVTQAQTFYLDFRVRILGLMGRAKTVSAPEKSIEEVIEATRKTHKEKTLPAQRYLYVDTSGELQFADSLEAVPTQYRKSAQPLAE